MSNTGIIIDTKKNEIVVYSDKYNDDKNYQKEIDCKLIQSLKR